MSAMNARSLARVARQDLPFIARAVVIALISWELAVLIGRNDTPVYAVLVPVLAVRTDPFASFSVSLARVVGVITGVLLGVAVMIPLQTDIWAVAIVLVGGLLIGMVLRIGGALNLQVAISALLVVVLGDPPGFAWERIWQTCLGAVVTVVLAPLLLPPNPAKALRRRLERLAADLAAEIRGVTERSMTATVTATLAQAAALREDLERARHASIVSPLQRRHRAAVEELRDRVELATTLAPLVALYNAETQDLMSRPEHQAEAASRQSALTKVADPTAEAVERALTGRPFTAETAAAQAQLHTLMASDVQAVSVILRRPLARMLEQLEAARGTLTAQTAPT